jgi:hypothetical protein
VARKHVVAGVGTAGDWGGEWEAEGLSVVSVVSSAGSNLIFLSIFLSILHWFSILPFFLSLYLFGVLPVFVALGAVKTVGGGEEAVVDTGWFGDT